MPASHTLLCIQLVIFPLIKSIWILDQYLCIPSRNLSVANFKSLSYDLTAALKNGKKCVWFGVQVINPGKAIQDFAKRRILKEIEIDAIKEKVYEC